MNSRETLLNKMRPSIDVKFLKIKNSSFEESFQNVILRQRYLVHEAIFDVIATVVRPEYQKAKGNKPNAFVTKTIVCRDWANTSKTGSMI